MNTSSCKTKTNTGSILESAAKFESDLAKADTVRGAALSGLQRLHTVRAKLAEREQAWLVAEAGAERPEVIHLKAEVEAEKRFGGALAAELDRVNAPAPSVDERGWALHGFVRNQDLQGLPNLTVALFDRSNRWIEQLGHTCTDKRGYFQLCFAGGKGPSVEQGREVFVGISDAKKQVLYRDKKPMKPVLGEVRYREIIIGEESATCPPPAKDSPARSDLTEVPARGDDSPERPDLNEVPAHKAKARKARTRKKTSKKAKPGA